VCTVHELSSSSGVDRFASDVSLYNTIRYEMLV